MILSYYYWYYQNVIPKDICDKIIKLALQNKKKLGLIGDFSEEDIKKDKTIVSNVIKKRNSNIVWLDDKWIYELIHSFLFDANKKAGWNFDVDFTELLQFTIYKKNQYYDWHVDQNPLPYSNKDNNYNGKIRKLSMSILLNDPSNFKGGQLEFDTPNGLFVCKELNTQGSLVVFPSNVKHRVAPVIKGTRYSLVSWTLGPPFK